MEETAQRLRDLVGFHCKAAKWTSPIAGLTLFRASAPSKPVRSLYNPRICIVLQGRKQIEIERRSIIIGPGEYLVVVLDLPVTARVSAASPREPHLALTLDLDADTLSELVHSERNVARPAEVHGAATAKLSSDLLEPVERLVRLLDRPGDIPTLAPLLLREIVYRLLQGELGGILRQYASSGSRLGRIAAVASWLKDNFHKSVEISELAAMAGMSTTTFHRNFKSATHMSPIQFRSRLRLHEARRRLSLGEVHIGAIAFDVGYRSQSQFNREYRAMFDVAPGQERRVPIHPATVPETDPLPPD